MKLMHKALLGLLAMLTAPAAIAQESGAFIGAELGYDRLQYGNMVKADGVQGRLFAGYDFVLENGLFLGAEAGALYSTAKDGFVGIGLLNPDGSGDFVPDFVKVKADWGLNALGRFGYTLDSGTKFYLLGGVAWRRSEIVTDLYDSSDVKFDGSVWDERFEWGLGFETPLTDQVNFRARLTTYGGQLDKQFGALAGVSFRF